jgi:hypothetical protein
VRKRATWTNATGEFEEETTMNCLSQRIRVAICATAAAAALAFGCSSSGSGASDTQESVGATQEAVMNSVCDCAMTARECFRGTSNDAGRHECGAEFKTCEQNALAALKALHDAIRACEKDAGMCIRGTFDAGFTRKGHDERIACVETERSCIQAALPPPPPCIQGLEKCIQDGGDRRMCLEQAFECMHGNHDAGVSMVDAGR